MPHNILIVDDEQDIRAAIRGILEDEGYVVHEAASADEALHFIQDQTPDLAILDVWLKTGERDGLDLLAKIRKRQSIMPILMMSGHGTIEMAVTAMKHGAYDFIEKPFQTERMLLTIERALEASELRNENKALREHVDGVDALIGVSQAIQLTRTAIEKVAPANSRVWLLGPAGAGKEVAVRMIHRLSPRATKPLCVVNCAASLGSDVEAILFGSARHPGQLHQASGGTLYLDEVADLPVVVQAKLLRVLQDQKYQHPVTGSWIEIDVRVISSSSSDPQELIARGTFREDLYYRLNVVSIHLPPISDRREDIPVFLDHFMKATAKVSGKVARPIDGAAMAALQVYHWPGNVRQLKNVAEWLVIMAPGDPTAPIDIDSLPPEINHRVPDMPGHLMSPELLGLPLREAREVFERAYLKAQVDRFGGSVSRAANFVQMERSALHRKLRLLHVLGDDEDVETPAERDVA